MVVEFISLLLTMAAFLFLKGMKGASAPFSYLVYYERTKLEWCSQQLFTLELTNVLNKLECLSVATIFNLV